MAGQYGVRPVTAGPMLCLGCKMRFVLFELKLFLVVFGPTLFRLKFKSKLAKEIQWRKSKCLTIKFKILMKNWIGKKVIVCKFRKEI